ncbi:MAG: Ig-like domain-containing protein [Lachnospiraceae bacterium]|nr:Ig-like domain-containing protein [Lachnospiraceae bacterium]
MKKNNIFDTEIQMVDLESMDNMEVSFDETSEPNPMLADDVRLNMKETQVISAEEIEKVMKENTVEDLPDSGETIVIPSRVIKKAVMDIPTDAGYSNASNDAYKNKTGFENDEFGETVTFDTRVINAAYEEKKNPNMLEPDESYDFEDDIDEPARKKVHHAKEKSEKELRAEEERQLRKEARAEARAEEREAKAEARAEEKMARAEAKAEAAAEAKEAKIAARAEAKELKAEAAAEAREAKLAARAEEKELKAEAAAEARESKLAARAEEKEHKAAAAAEAKTAAKQVNPAAKQDNPAAKQGNPAAKQANPAAKTGAKPAVKNGAKPAVKTGAKPAVKTGAKPVSQNGAATAARQGNPAAKPAAKPAAAKPAGTVANKPVQHAKSSPVSPAKTEFHPKGEQRPRVPEMPVKVVPPQEKKPAAPSHVIPDMGMTQEIPVENMNTEALDTASVNENIQENIHNVQNVSREKVVHKKSKKKSRTAFGIVEICGVAIALLLVILLGVLGVKLIEKGKQKNNVAQFASIGALYSEMDSIGNEGILAIGEKASISSVNVPEETESTEEGTEETDNNQNVSPVSVNFLSIEKDLKIKFLDKNTGKLISGIQFEVTAKGPKGDDFKWTDSDMDGMIYVDKLQPGNYEVKVLSVPPYEFPDTATTVKVQDTIVYQVINVIDEAQDMSQVDLAKEENNGKEVDEGNKLQDTVEFVESTATPIEGQDGYVKIDKSKIKDPATLQSAYLWGGFRRVDSITLLVGEMTVLNVPHEANQTLMFSSDNPDVVTVSPNGDLTAINEGVANVTASILDSEQTIISNIVYNVTVKRSNSGRILVIDGPNTVEIGKEIELIATGLVTWSSSDNNIAVIDDRGVVKGISEGTVTITAVSAEDPSVKAEFKITVKKGAVPVNELILSSYSETMKVGDKVKIKVTLSPEGADNPGITWSSDNTNVAVVDKGTITAVGSGNATILAQTNDGRGICAAVTVTVKPSEDLTLVVLGETNIQVTEVTVGVGSTYKLTPKVEGFLTDNGVTFSKDSSDAFSIDANGVIKGEKVGVGQVTVTTKENGKDNKPVVKYVKVTVQNDVTKDTTSKLKYHSEKDNADLPVYIKTADGKYVEATYADYYKEGVEFYVAGTVEYKYTGWQTLNGNVYYFTKEGKKVTGEQVIGGTKYTFASDGALLKDTNGSRGIDVSTYQGTIDWTAVKNSGISFVIIRCGFRGYTKGGLIIDSKYQSYIKGATAAGLKVGIYLFSQAVNEAEAVEEASLCVNLAQGYKISYPIFIDSEYANGAHNGRADGLDKATRTAVCKAFCETVKSAGYTPGVYASKSWFYNKLDVNQLNSYKIWLAHYTGQTDYTGKYDLWQHTDKGRVNGINGNVDLNFSYLGY